MKTLTIAEYGKKKDAQVYNEPVIRREIKSPIVAGKSFQKMRTIGYDLVVNVHAVSDDSVLDTYTRRRYFINP